MQVQYGAAARKPSPNTHANAITGRAGSINTAYSSAMPATNDSPASRQGSMRPARHGDSSSSSRFSTVEPPTATWCHTVGNSSRSGWAMANNPVALADT